MKYIQLRTNLLIALSIITLSLFIIFEYYNYSVRKQVLHQFSDEKLLILTKTMHNIEKIQKQIYAARTKQIEKKIAQLQKVNDLNSDKINSLIKDTIIFYHDETPSLEHVRLYNINTTLILDYKGATQIDTKHIDIQHNLVLREIKKTKIPQSGYVNDSEGTLYYSLIFPLFLDDNVCALIEYAIKANNIFELTSNIGRYKYAIYIHDKNTSRRKLGKLIKTNDSLFQKINLTQEYIDSYANQDKIISYNEKYYIFHKYTIETHLQEKFAQVIIAIDTTKFINDNKDIVITTFKLSFIVFIFILYLIYFILTKLINKLLKEEKELTHNKNQMQIVINNSDNLIALLENDQIKLANNTLLSYAGVSDLTSFIKKYSNLSKLFVQEKTTFTAKDAMSNTKWIEAILKLDEEDRVVALKHKEFGLNYFSIKINVHEDDYNSKIIIFSNISSLYKKSIKDEYLVHHDNLTNIYNRQYFNQTIAKNLHLVNQHKMKSSLLMLDLDFFKKVNDTYGHQIGDDVLIKFCQIISNNIREDDVFARWGGEEFVLLLENLDEETAFKVAQNLREKISQQYFEEVGHITCSIGLSQNQEGDTQDSWMARVDKALYRAKENGRNRVEIAI